jgi:hypothetical protein
VRLESTNPDTLDFVPQWYGERVLEHAEQNGARISLRDVTASLPPVCGNGPRSEAVSAGRDGRLGASGVLL